MDANCASWREPFEAVGEDAHKPFSVVHDRASQPHRFPGQRAVMGVLRDIRRLDRRITGPDAWIPRAVHSDNRQYLQDRLAATRVNLRSNPL